MLKGLYKIELITNLEEFVSSKTEWQKLEQKINNVQITNSYDYLLFFWKNFQGSKFPELGYRRRLFIIFLYKNEELIAVFPFCKIVRKRKIIFDVEYIEFLGQSFFTNYLDIIGKNIGVEDIQYTLSWIRNNSKFDVIQLSHIADFSDSGILDLKENGYPFTYSAELDLSTTNSYEEYKSTFYSKKYRLNINNLYNKIRSSGVDLKIEWKDFEEKDMNELRRMADFKLSSGKLNIYDTDEKSSFLKNVYTTYKAEICFIKFDGVNIGYLVSIFYNDQKFWFDMSFDKNYKRFWPGNLIFDVVLRKSFDKKAFRNILGWGEDFHKYQFCNKFYTLSKFLVKGNKPLSPLWYSLGKRSFEKMTVSFKESKTPNKV